MKLCFVNIFIKPRLEFSKNQWLRIFLYSRTRSLIDYSDRIKETFINNNLANLQSLFLLSKQSRLWDTARVTFVQTCKIFEQIQEEGFPSLLQFVSLTVGAPCMSLGNKVPVSFVKGAGSAKIHLSSLPVFRIGCSGSGLLIPLGVG